MRFLLIITILTITNFVFQAFGGQNWDRAVVMSIAEAGAVLLCWITETVDEKSR